MNNSPIAGPDAVPPPACPAHAPMPLYGSDFAANPAQYYDTLRRQGPVAPVTLAPGVPAMLVVGYDAALEVMGNPEDFPKDPRHWQVGAPSDSPVLPMMAYRPNCMVADGAEHARLRSTVTDSLAAVDLSMLRIHIERSADLLINQLASSRSADLITQYAMVLPLMVLNHLFGCPPSYEARLVAGLRAINDGGQGADAEKGNAELTQCLMDLVAHKRAKPGSDVISRMLAHPAWLTDEEMAHQLALVLGATIEPEKNLIANTVLLLLSDDRFANDLLVGSLPVEDALEEVLWRDPPVSNYAITYPRQDLDLQGVRLPADQPVVISFAAANTDPSLPRDYRGNRAHVTWGSGPHACPAQQPARLIASVAIEKLLAALPDLELAVPADQLVWRAGPFYHALTSLPVRFSSVSVPESDDRLSGVLEQDDRPAPSPSTSLAVVAAPRPTPSVEDAPHRWWKSLVRWWDGQ